MSRSPSSVRAADDAGGRVNQKRRTRRALLEAALEMHEAGADPTFAEIAEHAMVSRATAYRYFASVEALMSEALFERAVSLATVTLRAGEPAPEAAARVARELNALLLRDERSLHVMERSFMSVWLDNPPERRPARPGRRLALIEPLVDTLRDALPRAARSRLARALALVIGPEAMISLRDVAGATSTECIDASAWAARALVHQALAEAGVTDPVPSAAAAGPRSRRTTR